MESKTAHPSSEDLWLACLAKGGSMKELRGMGQRQLDAMYRIAYGRYDSGQYKDALLIFRHLCLLEHSEYRYFLGLGVTQVALEQFAQAAATLSYAESLSDKDPRASLAMAGCFVEMRNLSLAQLALVTAIKRARQSSRWKPEQTKAEQLLKFSVAGRR